VTGLLSDGVILCLAGEPAVVRSYGLCRPSGFEIIDFFWPQMEHLCCCYDGVVDEKVGPFGPCRLVEITAHRARVHLYESGG